MNNPHPGQFVRPGVELHHVVAVKRELVLYFLVSLDGPLLIRRADLDVRLYDDVAITVARCPFPLGVGQVNLAWNGLKAWVEHPSAIFHAAIGPRAGRVNHPFKVRRTLAPRRRDVRVSPVYFMRVAVPDNAPALCVGEGYTLAVSGGVLCEAGPEDFIAKADDTTSIISNALFARRSAHVFFQVRGAECLKSGRIPSRHERLLGQVAHLKAAIVVEAASGEFAVECNMALAEDAPARQRIAHGRRPTAVACRDAPAPFALVGADEFRLRIQWQGINLIQQRCHLRHYVSHSLALAAVIF